LRRQVLSN